MRARTVCTAPHCSQPAVRKGRCAQHKRTINGWQWQKIVAAVIARDNGICQLCGQSGATSADHIVRVRYGGTDALSNLRAAHVRCNLKRG